MRSAVDDIRGNCERYRRIGASKLRIVEIKLVICAGVARIICNRTVAIINGIGTLCKERKEIAALARAITRPHGMKADDLLLCYPRRCQCRPCRIAYPLSRNSAAITASNQRAAKIDFSRSWHQLAIT